MFRDNLFITNYSLILKSSMFINKSLSVFCAFRKLLNELDSVVSSAYEIKHLTSEKSIIYIINNGGIELSPEAHQ